MTDGTAFKLVMGFIMIAVSLVLWIPLNEMTGQIGDIFNGMTTDVDAIARNNTVVALFGATPVFLLLAYGIWVIKSAVDERKQIVTVG